VKRSLKHIVFVLLILVSFTAKSQQLPTFSQYVFNGFILNPAMAGYDGYTSVNTTARQQWLGISDAPQTFSASFQTRMLQKSYKIVNRQVKNKNKLVPSTKGRVGLGAYILNDANGNVARTGLQFTYAYHIIMGHNQLSFGLAPKLFQYRINEQALTFGRDDDPLVNAGIKSIGYTPDLDFGMYWTNTYYFIGLSVNNMFQSALNIGGGSLNYKIDRHYWLMGGYRFQITQDFDIEPSVLLKTTEKWIPQGDIGAKAYFMEDYWAGLSLRTDGSLITLFGLRKSSLFVGYSFDYAFASIQRFNFGTHELSVSYKFGDDARRYRWLRRY
jgi:type IX secretion system PorP/SprF family membrane protein